MRSWRVRDQEFETEQELTLKKKKKKNRFDCFIFEGAFPSFEILKILVVVGR